jgi:hypothetical protein
LNIEDRRFGYRIALSGHEAADSYSAVVVILSEENTGRQVNANLNDSQTINPDTRHGLQHVFVHPDYNLNPA